MHLFLLLAALLAIYASNSAQPTYPPPYAESYKAIVKSENILTEVILSMSENLPHLNDYRRHYAEITHVLYYIANVSAKNCNRIDYENLYDKFVDDAASEAINNPLKVVEATKKFLDDLNAKTDAIQKLVNISCANNINERDCNEVLHNFILNDPQKYEKESEILLSAGYSAKAFNNHANKFNYISKEMEAHKYLIKRPAELRDVFVALCKLIPILNPNDVPC